METEVREITGARASMNKLNLTSVFDFTDIVHSMFRSGDTKVLPAPQIGSEIQLI